MKETKDGKGTDSVWGEITPMFGDGAVGVVLLVIQPGGKSGDFMMDSGIREVHYPVDYTVRYILNGKTILAPPGSSVAIAKGEKFRMEATTKKMQSRVIVVIQGLRHARSNTI